MDPGTLQHLIDGYIKLRDKKAAIKKQQEVVLKEYTDAMIGIEDFLKAHLQEQGVNSVSCDAGTAFIKRKRSATLADKGVFREFVISSGNFDLCDFSAKVEAVEDWAEEHQGQLPPGVNFSSYEGVNIQRK
jgi:hypothetical protein